MAEPVLTVEYDLSLDELGGLMTQVDRGSWSEWVRRVIAFIMLWFAVTAWRDQHYWLCGLMIVVAAFMLIRRAVFIWWLLRPYMRKHCPARVCVEIDDEGLRYRHSTQGSQEHGERFWWSRLTNCAERDGDFELMFDGEADSSM